METNVGGLRAVELYYRGIREIETGDTVFLQSRTRLNTPDLGTMMPESFRPVAELSTHCLTLLDLELRQALEAVVKLRERDMIYRWTSVYMPLRALTEKGMQNRIVIMLEEYQIDTSRICFELSPQLLFEGTSKMAETIEQMRNRGFHFLLPGFGGANCPLMQLARYPVDHLLLSPEMVSYAMQTERSKAAVHAIVEFARGLEAEVIAEGVSNANQAEAFFQTECLYAAGDLSGKYMAARYIRRKGDS